MSHISLTIPRDDEKALVAGATMLLTLAGKIPNMELPEMDDGHCESCTSAASEAPTETLMQEIESFDSDPIASPPAATDGEPGDGPSDTPTTEEEETTATSPELDNSDPPLPWDARIHSGSKAKLQDGTWRKKRGVDPKDYNRVVEELKRLMAAPVIESGPFYWIHPESESYGIANTRDELNEILAGDGMAQEVELIEYEKVVTEWAPPPTTDVPPPPPLVPSPEVAGISPTEPEPTPDTFPAFLKAVTMKVQAKELTIEQVNNALQPHGVANLQLLGGRPDLIPQVWADLVAPK